MCLPRILSDLCSDSRRATVPSIRAMNLPSAVAKSRSPAVTVATVTPVASSRSMKSSSSRGERCSRSGCQATITSEQPGLRVLDQVAGNADRSLPEKAERSLSS